MIHVRRREPDEAPDEDPDRWGFYEPAGGAGGEKCFSCEGLGVAVLVEATGERATSLTLLCERHHEEYSRLWRAKLPEGELSAEEAARLTE